MHCRDLLLQSNEHLNNTLSFLKWFESLTDNCANQLSPVRALHRMTRYRGRDQKVADMDRPVLRADLARDDIQFKFGRSASLSLPVEETAGG